MHHHRPKSTILFALIVTSAVLGALSATADTVKAPDGLDIAYEIRGEASEDQATLLFVHCWSCERATWGDQLDRLAKDHHVVALDLPGHGASGKARDSWTVSAYGDDVAVVIDALELEDVILIGHSMGGPVSLEAAHRRPDAVRGVVTVDTLHNVEFEFPKDQWQALLAAYEKDFNGTCHQFIKSMFPVTSEAKLVTEVQGDLCDGDPAIAVALMRDMGTYDSAAALKAAGVPVRGVNAPQFPTAIEANQQYGDYDAVIMDGVGHFPHLEKPAEFEKLLRQQIDAVVAASQVDTSAP